MWLVASMWQCRRPCAGSTSHMWTFYYASWICLSALLLKPPCFDDFYKSLGSPKYVHPFLTFFWNLSDLSTSL